MKKYRVELRAIEDVEIEAESVIEAIKIAKEQNPGFYSVGVCDGENYFDIETCNGCGIEMLDDQIGGSDTDGNSYCSECHEASNTEYLAWMHQLTILGYEKGVMLSVDHKDEINELYGELEPDEALNYLIENNMVTKQSFF